MDSNSTTGEVVSADLNIVFSGTTVLSICLVALVSLLKKDEQRKTLHSAYDGLALISFTAFVTVVADLNYDSAFRASVAYHIYDMIMIAVVGCVYMLVGACIFFRLPQAPGVDMRVIGHSDLNISILILIITIPLVIIELFMIYGCIRANGLIQQLQWGVVLLGTLQKSIQAFVYHFHLKLRVPVQEKYLNATLYLKIIALFNLSLWFESIVMSDKEGESCMKTSIVSDTSGVVTAIYSTLIIDYRLVCFILFVEQALHIDIFLFKKERKKRKKQREKRGDQNLSPFPAIPTFEEEQTTKSRKSLAFGFGFVLGGIIFILQFLNILQYKEPSKAWINVFGMFTDLGVMLGVIILLRQIKDVLHDQSNKANRNDDHEIMSHAVDILVILMGTIGVLFWILKCSIMVIWAVECSDTCVSYYLYVNGIKFFIRTISLICQIYLFNRISDVKVITRNKELRKKPLIDFSLSLLILSCLAVFSNAIIDTYSSTGEEQVKKTRMTTVLKVLYDSGHPIHLGFCLHMVLHFCIVTLQFKRENMAAEGVFSPQSTSIPSTSVMRSCYREDTLRVPLLKEENSHNNTDQAVSSAPGEHS